MFSPSSGSVNSVTRALSPHENTEGRYAVSHGTLFVSGDRGIDLLRVDLELLDRVSHDFRVDLLVARECRERRDGDEARVDLKVVPQGGPAFAPAEPIGAE